MRDDAYRPILERYIHNAQERMGADAYQTAAEVAEVVVGVLDMEDPPLRVRTSAWAEELCRLKTDLDPTGRVLSTAAYQRLLG